jgi:predicted nucleotidyltransferase
VIRLESAIKTLADNKVNFVIVGGVAIVAHGSAYITKDLDFCYARDRENLRRIAEALIPFKPRPRGFPDALPFKWDEQTLQNGANFTLETTIGDIDLLAEVSGVGTYNDVFNESVVISLFGFEVKVLSIKGLIKAKRAAGRTKDLLVLPELEALQEALSEDDIQ